jgi:hypothetical protein
MTMLSTLILATGETEKGVAAVIFVVIWGSVSLYSWIKKATALGIKPVPGRKVPQPKRAQPPKLKVAAKQQYRPNMAPANAYPPSIIQRAQAMASYATRQPAPRKPGRKPPRLPPPMPAASGRVVTAKGTSVPAPAPSPSAPAVQVARRQSPGIVAAAAVMGLKADDMRQQIILAEILRPPMALREIES